MFIAQATLQFVKEHRNDDVKALLLQASRYPDVDMRSAVQQIEGWQHAVAKLPEWAATEGILYPPRLSMEQCSSEPTALYKASIMAGGSFADTSACIEDFDFVCHVNPLPSLCYTPIIAY